VLLVLSALAYAQSPLRVEVTALPLPGAQWVDSPPGDGIPDDWGLSLTSGALTVGPSQSTGATRFSWTPGTRASLCSAAAPVTPGTTVRLTTRVKGSPGLADVTAVHLRLAGSRGDEHVARRRFDTGAFPWEQVSISATVPAEAAGAYVCFEVQMVNAGSAGSFEVEPLRLEELRASSSAARLALRRIILVSIETLRWDHLSGNGYARATTPTLDRLMAEGVAFPQHYASAPYTHPSLASLITGQWPTTLGFVDNIPTLAAGQPTAGDLLAQAGYVTAAFNVQYVLSNRYGLNRGFHYYRNHPNDTTATVLNAELLPFLASHANDNLFAWVHYFDPHGPYRPPPAYSRLYEGDATWEADRQVVERGEASEGAPAVPKYIFDNGRTERRHYVARYDADIAYTDAELGRLVAALEADNRNDTLLIVTADHGESMTDHGRYFCHGSLYDHDLHVPFVVWGPGVVTPRSPVAGVSSHVDVLPTLLDYAGAGALPGFAGASLRPALEGGDLPDRDWVLSVVGRSEGLRYALYGAGGLKVMTNARGGFDSAWNVAEDPAETRALKGPARRAGRALAKQFSSWLKSHELGAPKASTLDDEDRERLRALGYLE
jgi:arylsulfatase A-like enzyme